MGNLDSALSNKMLSSKVELTDAYRICPASGPSRGGFALDLTFMLAVVND